MDFRILGAVELWDHGRQIPLGSIKERCVLAVLLLNADRLVSSERLIDNVWGDAPPNKVRDSLNSHISRLRGALSGTTKPVAVSIQGHHGGYQLDLPTNSLDLERFRNSVLKARDARTQGRVEEAVQLLRAGEDVWQGEALAGLTGDWAERARSQLHCELEAAHSDRIDDELRMGHYAELIGELSDLVTRQPTHERPTGQLMLALYGAGRQEDALERFRILRSRLKDELGDDPGPELQMLHERILRRDPDLAQMKAFPEYSPDTEVHRGVRGGGIHFAGSVTIEGDIVNGNKVVNIRRADR